MSKTDQILLEEIDIRSLSDEELAAVHAYGQAMRAEARPEDPPTSLELMKTSLEHIPDFVVIKAFVGRTSDGKVIAEAESTWTTTEDNQHLASLNVGVLAEFRRQGIGRKLLKLALAPVEAAGKTLVVGGTSERIPAGEAFARRAGFEPAMAMHTNRLVLADVDRDLVKKWIDEGPVRAPGYSLIAIDGAYPDDLIEDIVDVYHVMNDAPRDDLQMEDQKLTVEQLREMEKGMLATGTEHWSIFVRHDESGQLVGLTDVSWNPEQPDTVGQGNTGVRPEHRGHAIGKWLKAVMLQRILEERPGVVDVRTGNADSNDAMLGINKQLGFKPYIAVSNWQAPVETVRAYVGS